jgi:hypothetical protein
MNRPFTIPPLTTEDWLPDDKAVWRDPPSPPGCNGVILVTVEYGDGSKEMTRVGEAEWERVTSWRFGWALKDSSQ